MSVGLCATTVIGVCLSPEACICVLFIGPAGATYIYTLSLHDALPICGGCQKAGANLCGAGAVGNRTDGPPAPRRSEEHTSELQSRQYLVCRLLLEKQNSANTQMINGSAGEWGMVCKLATAI